MTGTVNQIEWAEQIRARMGAEFDRVAKALESAAGSQTGLLNGIPRHRWLHKSDHPPGGPPSDLRSNAFAQAPTKLCGTVLRHIQEREVVLMSHALATFPPRSHT